MRAASIAFLIVVLTVVGCKRASEDEPQASSQAPTASSSNPPLAEQGTGLVRWIIAGGGATPDSNQVQIEQDLALAHSIFEGEGRLLFAGGPDTQSVQVQDRAPRGDLLRLELGNLFSPRTGRDATYRKTTLPAISAATRDTLLETLDAALKAPTTEPLLLYIAAHGEMGQSRIDNNISLWGGSELHVDELARAIDDTQHKRPLRIMMTSCFSGGFAEIAFRGAVIGLDAAKTPRCGFFATTWDLEASGCDPNPDRRLQEGYGLHVLNALGSRDRHGKALPLDVLDIDGNGQISLLEAHTRSRIEARGIDVPTTTSERFLRVLALEDGASEPVNTPEEDAVIAALGEELGLLTSTDAQARFDSIEEHYAQLVEEENILAAAESATFRALAAEMLSRWPVIDDPWHPDFESTFTSQRSAIEHFLDTHPTYAAFGEATARLDAHIARRNVLMAERARVERLVRAFDTRLFAGRLKALGGSDWEDYERLLSCERGGL